MTKSPIESLLRAMQRRLWLERSLIRFRAGIWIGSLLLLAIAVIGAFWFPLAPLRAALAAVTIILIVMLSAISLRPSLKACALRADRQFDSNLLLTTALEMSTSPTPDIPAAGHVVLQQATDAVPRWRQHLNSVWHSPAPSGFALATIPVFIAVLLLSLSTYRDVDVFVNGPAPESTATESAGEYLQEDGSDLLALRKSIVRNSSQRQDVQSDEDAVSNEKFMTPDDAASRGVDKPLEIAASKAALTGPETEGPAGGREAGDARPTPQSGESAPDGASVFFAERSTVQIARLGMSSAGSEQSDTEFVTTTSAPAANRARVRPAAAPPTLSSWTTLTPAEIAYARRYLDRTETQRD